MPGYLLMEAEERGSRSRRFLRSLQSIIRFLRAVLRGLPARESAVGEGMPLWELRMQASLYGEGGGASARWGLLAPGWMFRVANPGSFGALKMSAKNAASCCPAQS